MKKYNLQQLKKAVAESYSFSEVVKNLPIRYGSSSIKRVRNEIENYSIDISHFGRRPKTTYNRKTIFIKKSKASSQTLKRWYLKILPRARHKCAFCGIRETYNGKPLKLQVDHIDGDSKNCMWKNLRLLCPNCHSQTETFSGRNNRKKI